MRSSLGTTAAIPAPAYRIGEIPAGGSRLATVTTSMAGRRRARRRAASTTGASLVGVLGDRCVVRLSGLHRWPVRRRPSRPRSGCTFPRRRRHQLCAAAMAGRVRSGRPGERRLHSAPAVADNRVVIRDQSGHVGAFDAGTGARIWSVQIGGAPLGTRLPPVVADGVVYGDRVSEAADPTHASGRTARSSPSTPRPALNAGWPRSVVSEASR